MQIPPLRRLAAPLAACAALALGACGGDGGEADRDARELLQRAFNTPVESGVVDLRADVAIDGVEELRGPIRLELAGPFADAAGPGSVPSADLDVSLRGGGLGLSGGLVLTGDNAFVSFQGEDYELGQELYRSFVQELGGEEARSLAQLGIDVADWIEDPQVDGEEEVAGAPTTKVVGEVDVLAVVDDLAALEERVGGGSSELRLDEEDREQVSRFVEDTHVEVYVAEDDGTMRRLVVEVEFEVPQDQREEAGGAEGGSASIEYTVEQVGREQRIEAPEDARPLADLLERFGLDRESLLQ